MVTSIRPRAAWPPLIALLVLTAATAAAQTLIPPQQDEAGMRERREAWLERIHAAAPGTDWRQIEAANQQATRLLLDGSALPLTSEWFELGADGVTGRTHTVAASVRSPGTLLVGTALGGMWSGNVHGGSVWTPLTDRLGIGIQQILVVPRAGRDDFLVSDGGNYLYYTPNGGGSWSVPAGLPSGWWGARRLLQDASTRTRVYVVLRNWFWTGSSWEVHDFLCRSTNGGSSFTQVHDEVAAVGGDLWMSRTSGSAIYWLAGKVLKRSTDLGDTFQTLGVVPVGTTVDQVRLAASEAGAPRIYALVHDSGTNQWGLAVSSGGSSWVTRSLSSQDIWGAFNASIQDSNQVLFGGVECWRSLNGGVSFTKINSWTDYYGDPLHKLHADIMGIVSLLVTTQGQPNQESMYINTDGGTYELPRSSSQPVNLTQSGLRNSQYYSVRTSRANPTVISAGSQDQGYQTATSPPSFTQNISGDYGQLTGALSRNDMVWSCYPGFLMLQRTESPVTLETPLAGSGFPVDTGIQWMPFLLADPADSSVVLFGARHLWRVKRTAARTFVTLGSLGDFDGGIGDAVGAVAIAPSDRQRWYVATQQGRLWYSTNGAASWTQSLDVGPASHYFYGSGLLVSPTDPLVAYACGSGYSNPGVYHTSDGGVTWTPYGSGLPGTLVHGLAFDNASSQIVYAATEAGPWRCVNGTWRNLLTYALGAPLSTYWCVESLPSQSIIRFGTYGRGIWDFHGTSVTAVEVPPAPPGVRLALGPNPSAGPVTLSWSMPAGGRVRIDVFDVTGRRLATPADERRAAGAGSVRFDGRDLEHRPLANGMYLVRIDSDHGRDVQRLLVRR